MFGESPYIGKGRFHQNEYTLEHHAHAKPSEVRHSAVSDSTKTAAVSDLHASMSRAQLDAIDIDGEMTSVTEDKIQQIDIQLQDKLNALAQGLLLL